MKLVAAGLTEGAGRVTPVAKVRPCLPSQISVAQSRERAVKDGGARIVSPGGIYRTSYGTSSLTVYFSTELL